MAQAATVSRGAKTLVALTIVAWGVAAAFVFQRATPSRDLPAAASTERFVSRGETTLGASAPPAIPLPLVRLQTPSAAVPRPEPPAGSAVALSPMDSGSPPPRLARSFPESNETIASRWGGMFGLAPASRSQAGQPARTHQVVDGDTLKGLSRRYLGSLDRFMEIYEANRDLLPNPEVLPIGAELKIPPRERESPPTLIPDGALVPVRPPVAPGAP